MGAEEEGGGKGRGGVGTGISRGREDPRAEARRLLKF